MKSKFFKNQAKIQMSYQNFKRRLFNPKSLILSEQLPYQIIATYHKAQVRYYASQQNTQRIPLILVSPLAVKMAIYDLFPYRSLVRYLSDSGFDVYLIEWGNLTRQDADLDFNYFAFDAMPDLIKKIKKHANSDEISLQGWSMAGIFCLLYAASGVDTGIRNLLIFGSPINSYASGNIGHGYRLANQLLSNAKKLNQEKFFQKIPNQILHTSGFLNALGFKLLNPIGILQGHIQLINRLSNLNDVKSHATLGNFLNHMIDYPGAINRDMLLWIWLKNPLSQGKFEYKGKTLDLKNISSALLIGAGDTDGMVTPNSVAPLQHLTSSQDSTFTLIPGGHLGLMCSDASRIKFWPFLTKWLEQRSIMTHH